MILEKQLLLHIILKGLQEHFQTIWSPSLYSEKDYSQVENIQDTSVSSIFPGGEVQASSPKVQNVQWSEKLQKN